MVNQSRVLRTALLMLIFLAGTSQAQEVRQGLQDIKTLKCEFRLMATGTWAPDGVSTGQVKAVSRLLGFSNIEAQEGTADAEGALGAPLVVVQLSGGYLHFMQIGPTGFLYVTTVFNRPSRPGRLRAVHTRHEYTEFSLPGYTSRPEQYYGECEAQR